MFKLSATAEKDFSMGFAAFETAASPKAPYILAANDHKGITEAFGMSATIPTAPAANASFDFANLG